MTEHETSLISAPARGPPRLSRRREAAYGGRRGEDRRARPGDPWQARRRHLGLNVHVQSLLGFGERSVSALRGVGRAGDDRVHALDDRENNEVRARRSEVGNYRRLISSVRPPISDFRPLALCPTAILPS